MKRKQRRRECLRHCAFLVFAAGLLGSPGAHAFRFNKDPFIGSYQNVAFVPIQPLVSKSFTQQSLSTKQTITRTNYVDKQQLSLSAPASSRTRFFPTHEDRSRPLFVSTSSPVITAVETTTFTPPPPPPTDEELHKQGLPLLVKAAIHADNGRVLLTELPGNGGGEVTYEKVLVDAGKIADYLMSRMEQANGETTNGEPSTTSKTLRTAHLTLKGSEYVSSMWGTWAAGYCSVPLAVAQQAPELHHVLTDSNPDVIFVGGGVTRKTRSGRLNKTRPTKNVPELIKAAEMAGMSDRIVYLKDILDDDSDVTVHQSAGEETSENEKPPIQERYSLGQDGAIPSMDTPALVMYTSGTTGKPKGVLTTHRNIYHQITDLIYAWGWQPSDVALHLLPLHHVHGAINILLCAAYAGACCELHDFHCEQVWWRLASKDNDRKPNVLMAVPTVYAKLLEKAEELPPDVIKTAVDSTLRPMRLQISGSAALPASVLERWKDLTGHTLLERYGMTEFAMALSNPYEPMEKRNPGHVGLPLPSVEVRIKDDNGNIIPPGQGSGELQVRGPVVFKEYLNRPDATEESFDEDGSGFFKTGDVADFDPETNSYRILGRASVDIIKTGGHKLSALEIERDLLEHPDIQELAVVGVQDDTWGERVGLICRMKHGRKDITLEELRDWCENRMAKYKVPSRLVVVKDIPKNAMGKVNKKNLRSFFDVRDNVQS